MSKIFLFFFVATTFLSSYSQTDKSQQQTINIKSDNDKINIYENTAFFKEKGNQEFDLKRLTNDKFNTPERLYYHIPLKRETLWMRFSLKNIAQKDLLYYYTLRAPYLYKATVYIVLKNKVTELHTYSYQNIKKENRYSNYPTWKISIPNNEEIQVYTKIYEAGERTVKTSSVLKGEKDFLDYSMVSFGVYAIFILFILITVIISIYISAYTKKLFVLFYASYVFFICIDYLCSRGIGQSYIWSDIDFLLKNTRRISNTLSALFLCLFFVFFYDSYKIPSWIKRVFQFSAIVFGVFLCLYIIKFFVGDLTSSPIYMWKYIWKAISCLAIILIYVHSYLAYKKIIPLYLPLIFILHTSVTSVYGNYIFPYSNNVFIDWLIMNIYYVSLSLEIIVLSYYILKTLKKEKDTAEQLKIEFDILQEESNAFKEKHLGGKSLTNEFIHLKSKAILNSDEILYIKSDGHYVEYYLENKNNPEIDRNSLNKVSKILPSLSFVRVNKSYIVNIHCIKIINSTELMLDNGKWINLSRIYKSKLKDILHNKQG